MPVEACKSIYFDKWFNKYIELLSSGLLRSLGQCYLKPSEEKQEAYCNCLLAFNHDKGKHDTVLLKNNYRFSVAYVIPDLKCFIVYTTHKRYVFDLTDTQFKQYENAVVQYNAVMNKWRVK